MVPVAGLGGLVAGRWLWALVAPFLDPVLLLSRSAGAGTMELYRTADLATLLAYPGID